MHRENNMILEDISQSSLTLPFHAILPKNISNRLRFTNQNLNEKVGNPRMRKLSLYFPQLQEEEEKKHSLMKRGSRIDPPIPPQSNKHSSVIVTNL